MNVLFFKANCFTSITRKEKRMPKERLKRSKQIPQFYITLKPHLFLFINFLEYRLFVYEFTYDYIDSPIPEPNSPTEIGG